MRPDQNPVRGKLERDDAQPLKRGEIHRHKASAAARCNEGHIRLWRKRATSAGDHNSQQRYKQKKEWPFSQ
jgi:hypothetical protein